MFTIWVPIGRILQGKGSYANTFCGAAAVYLLPAVAWAASFAVIEKAAPGAFDGLSSGVVQSWNELLYLSLTTLTTLGYGDIKPIDPFARIWATLEPATGVLYIAILVASLVNVYRRDR